MKIPEGPKSGHEAIAGFFNTAEEGARGISFRREVKRGAGYKIRMT
jgi:hypothetical protein